MNRAFFTLATTLAVQALVSMSSTTPPVLAPEAAVSLGVPATTAGVFVSLVYLGAMLSSVVSGPLVIRFGAIRVSQACLLLCALSLAASAYEPPWLIAISALVMGFGYGPITPASSHVLARNTPAHLMSMMFSLKQTGVPIGGALAGLLVPPFVLWWGWQGAALAVAAACVVMSLVAQTARTELDADRDPSRPLSAAGAFKPLFHVLATPSVRSLALSTFAFGAVQLSLTTFLVSYLTHHLGISLVAAGTILAACHTGGFGGRLFWGVVADRWIRPSLLLALLALVMGGCSVAMALVSPHWPVVLVVALAVLFGATAIGWNGVYLAEVARLAPPGQAGAMTGGALFFTYFGVVVGPLVFASLANLTDSMSQSFLYMGLVLMPIGAWLLLRSRKETRQNA